MQVPHYSPGEEPKDELVLGEEPNEELKKEPGVEVNRELGPSISVHQVCACTTRNTGYLYF